MDANQSGANGSSDFVRKLYKMLENNQDNMVVRWGDEGDSFVVLENEKFTKHILPKHFKHSNFASFVRQLNKYDFHKVRHSTEDNQQSPYGPGAWEFKHPDFKINNEDALENIRRKAPAPRRPNMAADDMLMPTHQVDLLNTQLVATQQQLQHVSDRYNELSMHHSVLVQEMIGLQKTVVNHEHVMQYVMNFLHTIDAQRKGGENVTASTAAANAQSAQSALKPTFNQSSNAEGNAPASPLQSAAKLLSETTADQAMHSRNLEHMNELSMRMNAALTTPPPEMAFRNNGLRSLSRSGGPHSASSSSVSYNDLDNLVYPVGHSNGIDPAYSGHINNIPYPLPNKSSPASGDSATPTAASAPPGRKKSQQMDPGWIRSPQILLVEDDGTCRRIGSKFLYTFHCTVDSALDGLEAVNKMNAGSKYDLVLMDIIMPNLDGVSATHLIRQFDSTPIVAMTSNIRSDDIAMYFQHGMNDVLPKPFTKEGLMNMLEKHLSHLKKSQMGADPMGPPSALAHTSARPSLKSEESPATSPASLANNWHSPSHTMSGVSPGASGPADEYSTGNVLAPIQTSGYQMTSNGLQPNPSPSAMSFAASPTAATVMSQHLPQTSPRRAIADISDGPGDSGSDHKRQMVQGPAGTRPPMTGPGFPAQQQYGQMPGQSMNAHGAGPMGGMGVLSGRPT